MLKAEGDTTTDSQHVVLQHHLLALIAHAAVMIPKPANNQTDVEKFALIRFCEKRRLLRAEGVCRARVQNTI